MVFYVPTTPFSHVNLYRYSCILSLILMYQSYKWVTNVNKQRSADVIRTTITTIEFYSLHSLIHFGNPGGQYLS